MARRERGDGVSETRPEYKFTPADADAIANAMAAGDGLIDGNIRALRVSVKTLSTQLRNEKAARLDAESSLRGELEELREELATQRRVTAQMMRERETIETVCAWCGSHLEGLAGAAPEHVSHGICEKCLEEKFPERVTA
jgi:hypothetical protein